MSPIRHAPLGARFPRDRYYRVNPLPDRCFRLRDQLACLNLENPGDLEQNHDVGALDAALNQTDEGSVEARRLRKLLLGDSIGPPRLAERDAECPLRTARRLDLNGFLDLLAARQVTILRFSPYAESQI
jgi:hypothetical protein